MALTFRHSTRKAQVFIVNPQNTSQCITTVAALEVIAIVVWFLGNLPAQKVAVQVVGCGLGIKRYLEGWREDLRVIGLALVMMMRLEFV